MRKSIEISSIDIDKCYFNPGCAMAMEEPESTKKIFEFLKKYYGCVKYHDICCHHDPKLPEGSVIINNCAGCDQRWSTLYKGINTITIWEILDSIDNLPLPNHKGLIVSIHDPCPVRTKPQVHLAVRSLLEKMGIEIIEADAHGTTSICCGDCFYPTLIKDEVVKLQKKRASQMPCNDVVVYCISCVKSMAVGNKNSLHMVDLVLNTETIVGDINVINYHNKLDKYIKEH